MIPTSQAQQIVAALDLQVSDAEAQRLAERILSDNFAYNAILRALLAEAAPLALRQIRAIERRDLLERLHVHPSATRVAAPPIGTATWVVRKNRYSEKPEIVASCSACNQSVVVPHFAFNAGISTPTFSHCGKNEAMPSHVIEEFAQALDGPTDADRAYEAALFKERNKQIVEEQARKDRALTERLVGQNNVQVPPPPPKFL
jgi:hypothetical protein